MPMDREHLKSEVEEAEGYLMLGMLLEAWDVVEELVPEDRTAREVLEIRLRILTGMKKWEREIFEGFGFYWRI